MFTTEPVKLYGSPGHKRTDGSWCKANRGSYWRIRKDGVVVDRTLTKRRAQELVREMKRETVR